MTIAPPLRADQAARERSLGLAIGFDAGLNALIVVVALAGGSLTMMAESVRACLMLSTEVFGFVALRRIHRGRLVNLEFGHGKLEQIANLTIAAGMLLGAAWISVKAFGLLTGTRPPGNPLGFAAAALVGALNTYLNFVAWLAIRAAASDGSSIIMRGQLQARVVKLASSALVLVFLTFSALYHDPLIDAVTDVFGALIVTAILLFTARDLIRGGLPDMLDTSIDAALQQRLNRALARHFADYDGLGRVRTRRSGGTVFIEIGLGFGSQLSIAEVDRRVARLRKAVEAEIPGAEVAILAGAVESPGGAAQSGLDQWPAPDTQL